MERVFCFLFFIYLFFLSSTIWASNQNFSFYTYDGKRYTFSDFRGHFLLINFFTSYCPPCILELKVLKQVKENCNNKNFQIISFMIDKEGIPLLPKIVSSRGLNYLIGFADSQVLKNFPDLSTTPTTYLIDNKGQKIEKLVGYKSYKVFLTVLNKYQVCKN